MTWKDKHKPGCAHSLPECYCYCLLMTGDWELDLSHTVTLDLILVDCGLKREKDFSWSSALGALMHSLKHLCNGDFSPTPGEVFWFLQPEENDFSLRVSWWVFCDWGKMWNPEAWDAQMLQGKIDFYFCYLSPLKQPNLLPSLFLSFELNLTVKWGHTTPGWEGVMTTLVLVETTSAFRGVGVTITALAWPGKGAEKIHTIYQ